MFVRAEIPQDEPFGMHDGDQIRDAGGQRGDADTARRRCEVGAVESRPLPQCHAGQKVLGEEQVALLLEQCQRPGRPAVPGKQAQRGFLPP